MTKMHIYLDDGRIFTYEVASVDKVREHTHAIITTGYRHVGTGFLEHYPPHRIDKVKAVGEEIETNFPDMVSGT